MAIVMKNFKYHGLTMHEYHARSPLERGSKFKSLIRQSISLERPIVLTVGDQWGDVSEAHGFMACNSKHIPDDVFQKIETELAHYPDVRSAICALEANSTFQTDVVDVEPFVHCLYAKEQLETHSLEALVDMSDAFCYMDVGDFQLARDMFLTIAKSIVDASFRVTTSKQTHNSFMISSGHVPLDTRRFALMYNFNNTEVRIRVGSTGVDLSDTDTRVSNAIAFSNGTETVLSYMMARINATRALVAFSAQTSTTSSHLVIYHSTRSTSRALATPALVNIWRVLEQDA
ncbi:hypothetical protein AB1Y20_014745 [Prymnesium parvum]|uniref:Uncharacterized protein n=1 Tax=Prymnesium parvum TaxID=97485 RepID=A0AB34IE17_PRYPA